MINENQSVETHYTVTNLGETILSALQNMCKDPNSLTHSDLAPLDEFHIRGSESTQELEPPGPNTLPQKPLGM